MAFWNPDLDVELTDSEDEDEVLGKDFSKGREAMLFVLDANLYEHEERFKQALELIRSAFISGLLINDKDLLGIVFANTEMSPEPYEASSIANITVPENCSVFLPLRQLTKSIAEHFLRFIETAQKDFGTLYGIAGNGGCGSFSTMIRLCLNLFDHCGYGINNGQIVYLTDRTSPHKHGTHEHQLALQKAKDLEGRSIEFHVIPMVDEFRYEEFYKEFLCLVRDIEMDSFVPQDPQYLREILTNRKLKQNTIKRCVGHINFSLGPNLEISAQFFNYIKRSPYPRKIKLLRKNNSIISQHWKIMLCPKDEETQDIVGPKEVKSTEGWYEICCEGVEQRITPEQVNRVRNLHAPGMMLLGFKPRSSLPDNLYYKPCSFMYPDDRSIVGSKRLFSALLERCETRNKIAICLFMSKRNSIPRYVALVPVIGQTEDGLISGDGFKIVYLPMGEHIRLINFNEWLSIENAAPEEGVEVFQKIINKLRMKYDPQLINDPNLETLQSHLLALALNIKSDNEAASALPDTDVQDKRIAELLPKLERIFGEEIQPAKKRAAPKATTDETQPKKTKITSDDIKAIDFVKKLVVDNELGQCTIEQLRCILNDHFNANLPKSYSKQKLIDKVKELA